MGDRRTLPSFLLFLSTTRPYPLARMKLQVNPEKSRSEGVLSNFPAMKQENPTKPRNVLSLKPKNVVSAV